MRSLILIFLLVPFQLLAQLRDSVRIVTPNFTILYSEKLEQPLKVEYQVLCCTGKSDRTGLDFYLNDSIHTSDGLDYFHNVYDKGHLAPAGDFACTREMMYTTFTYLNCSLQNQYLNRGVWKSLEWEERVLAQRGDVFVTVELLFGPKSKVLPTGATVPMAFKKTLHLKAKNEKWIFVFPNQKPKTDDFWLFLLGKFPGN